MRVAVEGSVPASTGGKRRARAKGTVCVSSDGHCSPSASPRSGAGPDRSAHRSCAAGPALPRRRAAARQNTTHAGPSQH